MLKRAFVSLSFSSSKKLQILQLESSKKKVKKFLSTDLPDGLIQNLRVQDEDALAKILKDLWKKTGFREKSVGIVVPESTTFTKTISLPKLITGELDEAVRWQAYEFLPYRPKEVVIDWKIIKEEELNYQILIVAMQKDILQGYVRAASKAGLFPLVVETPSLSLVRISDDVKEGRLVLYESFGEAILLVAEGEKIIGSSVVNIDDHEEVVRMSKRMLRHYEDLTVERVVVGGPKIDQQIAKKLEKELGKQVIGIRQVVAGMNQVQFHEYLIPISLQLKDPAEPADEATVNLLPQDLVKKYENERLKSQIWSLTLIVTLIVWICFFTSLGAYMFLGQQVNAYKNNDLLRRISPEKAQTISQIEEINIVSKKTLDIIKVSYSPQTVINAISEARLDGVTINKYNIDLEAGNIVLIGRAATRQTLIDFKKALEEYKDFSLVQMPITSFEKEADLEFSMTFKYLPMIGKKTK